MESLTIKQAAKLLSQLPVSSTIELQKLPDNRVIVTNNGHQTKTEIVQERFSNLVGSEITVSEAAKKYNLHRNTILKWAKLDYVKVVKGGYRMTLDEADIAYCHYVYQRRKERGITRGTPLLRRDASPYDTLKHPSIAKLRKNGP